MAKIICFKTREVLADLPYNTSPANTCAYVNPNRKDRIDNIDNMKKEKFFFIDEQHDSTFAKRFFNALPHLLKQEDKSPLDELDEYVENELALALENE